MAALTVGLAWAVTADWLVAVELSTLLIGLWLVAPFGNYPLLPIVVVSEWLAVTIAPLYLTLTGRRIVELHRFDPTTVVTVGCAALVMQFVGIRLGLSLGERPTPSTSRRMPLARLVVVYLVMSLVHTGLLRLGASAALSVAQIVNALDSFRFVVLYLLVSQLLQITRGAAWVLGIAVFEVLVIPYGWMADFAAPMVLMAAAVWASMQRRPMTVRRWLTVAAGVVMMVSLMVVWTGIKMRLRQASRVLGAGVESNRLAGLGDAGSVWLDRGTWKRDTDNLVSRVWAVYYAGLAYRRVPASLPHTDGQILASTLTHIVTPRFLFPDKATLYDVDTNSVRHFAGVWVAGARERTAFAFGRLGESYVDFGIVGTILLELALGFFLATGLSQVSNRLSHPELRHAITATLMLSVCKIENSWIMTLGPTLVGFLVVGSLSIVLDRYWARRSALTA